MEFFYGIIYFFMLFACCFSNNITIFVLDSHSLNLARHSGSVRIALIVKVLWLTHAVLWHI